MSTNTSSNTSVYNDGSIPVVGINNRTQSIGKLMIYFKFLFNHIMHIKRSLTLPAFPFFIFTIKVDVDDEEFEDAINEFPDPQVPPVPVVFRPVQRVEYFLF
jgi:hypothetical protein